MRLVTKENLIIAFTVFCLFFLFFFSWLTNGGASVYGLYSGVDGQLFAWLAKFLTSWGKPFDMNLLNPFQGMGSIFIPVNSWWNPGALILGLPNSQLINVVLSYSIYWIEIFFAIYFLAKTTGLSKIESIFAAETFVLLLFPPFSGYFNISPLYSLVPIYAHLLALMCMMTVAYVKLGEGGIVFNLFLVFFLLFASFIMVMSTGFGFIPCVPIYALIAFGFTLQRHNRQQLLWKIGIISLVACFFFVMHGLLYYKYTVEYVAASIGTAKAISFSIPKIWQNHTSIFYGASPLFSYFHIFALLGGLVGIFCQQGKYRWIAFSFIIIILLPDTAGFLFENGIISGSISYIGINYYVLNAYPLYCIFFTILMSFLLSLINRMMGYLISGIPVNIVKSVSKKSTYFHAFFLNYLKLLIPLILPVLAFNIWFGTLSKSPVQFTESNKTPIVEYLEKNIGLKPGETFRGTTTAYFASKNSSLRQINLISRAETHFTTNHYIMAREFLDRRFQNRHMLSDLWTFNIPTLEEYGHWISLPMYVFFKKMLSDKGDVLNNHFLNIYKLDLKVLRALGVRFVVADKILNEKDLSFVMLHKQKDSLKNGYVDSNVTIVSQKILDELENKFKNRTVSSSFFEKEFRQKLDKIYPSMRQHNEKILIYFHDAATSALGGSQILAKWSYADLEKIKVYFNIAMFTWMASPPLYLYEIKNPNLATYSPTHVIQVNSANELFQHMKKPDFSFEKSIIVQDALPRNIINQLITAKNSEMRFERNAVRVKAESAGWSLLLLPLQYSHCFSLDAMTPTSVGASSVRIIRANLIHAALLFKGKVDVKLNFDFGIGRNVYCRQKDILDMQYLSVIKES